MDERQPEFIGTAKRLANHLETKAAEIIPQLLAESRTQEASEIMHHVGCLVARLRRIPAEPQPY